LTAVDRAILEWLNGEAQGQPWRVLAQIAAVGLVVVPLLIFAAVAVGRIRDRSTTAAATAALTVAGIGIGLAANYEVEHLYFRPRPYWVLASVHPLLPRDGDTSFMPWQVIVAAAAATGVALLSRTWLLSAAATVLVMVGCVAVAQNYPSDTLAAAVVGAAFVAVLVPLRHRMQRVLVPRSKPEAVVSESTASTTSRSRALPRLAVAACVALAAVGGYMLARVQEHGTTVALSRANARLVGDRLPSDVRVYSQVSIDDLASGKVKATHARIYGKITYIHRYEPDGDVHLEIRAPDDAFVVLEVPPEFPLPTLPSKGKMITAWGITRKDGLHQWWELHPLVGWLPGQVNVPSRPDLQD
jgi:membrane-associated phospholipid phosphatase